MKNKIHKILKKSDFVILQPKKDLAMAALYPYCCTMIFAIVRCLSLMCNVYCVVQHYSLLYNERNHCKLWFNGL